MTFERSDIERVAVLARLRLDAQDVDKYADSLAQILELIEQMNEVETEDIAPLAHPRQQPMRLRPDVITETDKRDEFMKVAPNADKGLYLVPKVIE
jgi:aspartyl-tRNA(Asn)/glutamyl-tRNA(Gln) amidotransferase subunit C